MKVKLFDHLNKDSVLKSATKHNVAAMISLATKSTNTFVEMLRIVKLDSATRKRIRDTAAASNKSGQKILAHFLDSYAAVYKNPNQDGPVIFPPSALVIGRFVASLGPFKLGQVVRYEIGNVSVHATRDVSGSSPVQPVRGLSFAAGNAPIIIKARYYIAFSSTPASAQSVAVYRISSSADHFITSFKRRAAASVAGIKTIAVTAAWSLKKPPPPPPPPPPGGDHQPPRLRP